MRSLALFQNSSWGFVLIEMKIRRDCKFNVNGIYGEMSMTEHFIFTHDLFLPFSESSFTLKVQCEYDRKAG